MNEGGCMHLDGMGRPKGEATSFKDKGMQHASPDMLKLSLRLVTNILETY